MAASMFQLPETKNRVWINVCVDHKTEIYELLTESEEPDGSVKCLWHQEYPLGMGLADFQYANLIHLEEMITEFRADFEACSVDGDELAHKRVFFVCRYCLFQSPLMVPMVVCMEQLRLHQKTLEDVLSMLEEYKALFPKLHHIAHDFFMTDKADNMAERYWNCTASDPENFFPLEYATIRCGRIQKLYNNPDIRFSYDLFPRTVSYKDVQGVLIEITPENKPEVKAPEIVFGEILNTESPQMLASFLISRYIEKSMRMKRCKFCQKLFGVTTERGPSYCSRRLGGSSKTCREAGSLRLYEQKMMEDPALREYKKSYKTHNARIRRGQMTREEFDAWAEDARTKRDQFLSEQIDREEFITWLNQDIRN